MNCKRLFGISCAVYFLLWVNTVYGQQTWTLAKKDKGVEVFVRDVSGADFDEFKGTITVNSRMEVVGEVLRDVANYPQWVADCPEAKIIEKQDAYNMTLYLVQATPWPVDNRDVVLKASTLIDGKTGRMQITMVAVGDKRAPVHKGYVRMPKMQGQYVLEYLSRDKTKITYIVQADPGGSLPSSLANFASADLPYRTLLGLEKMTKLPKYTLLGQRSVDKQAIEDLITKGYLKN